MSAELVWKGDLLTVTAGDQRVGFHGDHVDAIDLLLDLTRDADTISRGRLVDEWKRDAVDINTSEAARRFAESGKGSLATAVLGNMLRSVERIGAVQKVGTAPRHAVRVLDRPLLELIVKTWDTPPQQEPEAEQAPEAEPAPSRQVADVTRWRQGDRDPAALAAHLADLSAWRRARAAKRFGPAQRAHIIREITGGRAIGEVAAALGLHTASITNYARRVDPAWGEELDAALMAGRDPNIPHGTTYSYRVRRCRCPVCRRAHHRGDKPRAKHARVRPVQRRCECCGDPVRRGTVKRPARFCSSSCGTRHSLHGTCPCGPGDRLGEQGPDLDATG